MKLAAIALSFIVPLVLTTFFLVREENYKINFAQQEQLGVRYLRPVSRLLVHVEIYGSLIRQGDAAQASRTESTIDSDLRDVLAVDAELHDELQTTSAALGDRNRGGAQPSRLQSSWEAVKLSGGGDAGAEQIGRLVADVETLIVHVGDSSKLILDPDLDTYYVMDALLAKEPQLVDMLSHLDTMVNALPADGSAVSADQRAELAGAVALLRDRSDGLKTDIENAIAETGHLNNNNELRSVLTPLLTRASDATNAVADGATVTADKARYRGLVREAVDAHTSLWTALLDQEAKMLQSREDGDLGRRRVELSAVAVSLILSAALTMWVARRLSRNVGAVAAAAGRVAAGDLSSRAPVNSSDEVGTMASSFNAMAESLESLVDQLVSASEEVTISATQLNSAADQLAATTTEQSAAVTEASATTEELARASASIADTVDAVALQTGETRTNLEQAERDIQLSSERTLALAELVSEIGSILTLINEIADQTNLLALNAAIEAARAGEAGRGFAVVAEEVRRLAERSKTSAGEIHSLIEGIQTETNATVMAMEKGGKQMLSGLSLLSAAADGTSQVRLTTQQQRSATAQVVETMEQLSDASRQVSATATQIAAASATLATLAANLQRTASTTASRGERSETAIEGAGRSMRALVRERSAGGPSVDGAHGAAGVAMPAYDPAALPEWSPRPSDGDAAASDAPAPDGVSNGGRPDRNGTANGDAAAPALGAPRGARTSDGD
jgi:methyl-accepting chemotaxis protein